MSDTLKTFTESDTLAIASGIKSVGDMINKITSNGVLEPQYTYLYSDLFVVLNRIHNNGKALDTSINDSLKNTINGAFDNAHYHVGVAIGLAAGIITSPGVSVEVSKAKDAMDEANSSIKSLSENVSQMVAADETVRYVKGLQSVSNDSNLDVDRLIRNLFWTMLQSLNNPNATQQDFQVLLDKIHLEIITLEKAKWSAIYSLKGLTINTANPGTNDDLEKVNGIFGGIGQIVGLLSIGVMAYNWKANGVNPFQSFKNLYQRIRGVSVAQAEEAAATAEQVSTATVEVSIVDIINGVLAIVGAILLIITTIISIVQLSDQLNKINDAKSTFDKQYGDAKTQVLSVVESSESFRPKKTN